MQNAKLIAQNKQLKFVSPYFFGNFAANKKKSEQ